MADETVCYEPISDGKFPVKQGKYREFLQFNDLFGQKPHKKHRSCRDLAPNSLMKNNRGIILVEQEIETE
jgi:hypothetical protein